MPWSIFDSPPRKQGSFGSAMFTAAETVACRRLLELALEEDLGSRGDLTSQAVIPAALEGRAAFVARSAGVVAGLPAVTMVFTAIDSRLRFEPLMPDGTSVSRGDRLAIVGGLMRGILAG